MLDFQHQFLLGLCQAHLHFQFYVRFSIHHRGAGTGSTRAFNSMLDFHFWFEVYTNNKPRSFNSMLDFHVLMLDYIFDPRKSLSILCQIFHSINSDISVVVVLSILCQIFALEGAPRAGVDFQFYVRFSHLYEPIVYWYRIYFQFYVRFSHHLLIIFLVLVALGSPFNSMLDFPIVLPSRHMYISALPFQFYVRFSVQFWLMVFFRPLLSQICPC